MRKVAIVNGNLQYSVMFENFGWQVVRLADKADIVCFTGGEDVSPSLYNEPAHPTTMFSPERDAEEMEVFKYCIENNIPMCGICRGGQFLNVMNGGKLWQNVYNHAISTFHGARRIDHDDNVVYMVTSTHHQMMRPSEAGLVLVEAAFIDKVETVGESAYHRGIEAVFYNESKCLCFQPHPEFYNNGSTRKLFFDLLDEYIFQAGA